MRHIFKKIILLCVCVCLRVREKCGKGVGGFCVLNVSFWKTSFPQNYKFIFSSNSLYIKYDIIQFSNAEIGVNRLLDLEHNAKHAIFF